MKIRRNNVLCGVRLLLDDPKNGIKQFCKDGEVITYLKESCDGGVPTGVEKYPLLERNIGQRYKYYDIGNGYRVVVTVHLQNKVGFSFGSYGWAQNKISIIEETFKSLNWNVPVPTFQVKYIPQETNFNELKASLSKLI